MPGELSTVISVFDEHAWERTVYEIAKGQCAPFIGAGASADHLPVAKDLAAALAKQYNFPFADRTDLAQVSQFAAVTDGSGLFVKQRLIDAMFAAVQRPDFSARDQPHALLAELGLPIYLTTNYDDFMYEALAARGLSPQRAICPWYTSDRSEIEQATALFRQDGGYNPDGSRPIVYHLHGHYSVPESLVVTEDDYVEFLVRVSADSNLLPYVIREALAKKMLLFVGYRLADWTFRVIFRGLVYNRPRHSRHLHVSVQLPPQAESPADERPLRIQEYMDKYFGQQDICICWKTARDFSEELRRRWEQK
jgi:hypothetical protein